MSITEFFKPQAIKLDLRGPMRGVTCFALGKVLIFSSHEALAKAEDYAGREIGLSYDALLLTWIVDVERYRELNKIQTKTHIFMRKIKKTKFADFNYIGSIELPEDVIKACNHSGPCDDDVERSMELPEVRAELSKIDPAKLRQELKEYGAWDEKELSDHTDNLKRILWIAAGNIQDGQ